MGCSLLSPGVREAYWLSWLSVVATVVAFVAGAAVAAATASSATLGFALENLVDCFSSGLVLWRFWGGGKSIPEERLEWREKRASVGIAISFAILSIVVFSVAVSHLAAHEEPSDVVALYSIAAPSLVVFGALGVLKLHVGVCVDSASLKKDAACSLCGALLSLGVLIGASAVQSNPDMW